jgi:hypothetical protein
MMQSYHQRLVEQAEAAASTGSLTAIFASMKRHTIIWMVPT